MEKVYIAKLMRIERIVFQNIDLDYIDGLVEVFQNMKWGKNMHVTELNFENIKTKNPTESTNADSFSNFQELITELN